MQTKVLEVINDIRASKNMEAVVTLNEGDKLRDDLGPYFIRSRRTLPSASRMSSILTSSRTVSLILLVRFMQNLAKCNAVFLVDNDKTYTYEDLFCSLNHAIEYCPLLKTRDATSISLT